MKNIDRAIKLSDAKYTGKTWNEFVSNVESKSGYKVDSAYKRKYDQWIELLKGGKSYSAEVTKYSDGSYELMDYNISKRANDRKTVDNVIKVSDAYRRISISGWQIQDDVLRKTQQKIDGFEKSKDIKSAKKLNEELKGDVRDCLHQISEAYSILDKRKDFYKEHLRTIENREQRYNKK